MRSSVTSPVSVSRRSLAALLLGAAFSGCTIADTVLAPAEDVIIVEGIVKLFDDLDGQEILVYLHRSLSEGGSLTVPGATVTITLPSGEVVAVPQASPESCVAAAPGPLADAGTCYFAEDDASLGIAPGDRLELTIETDEGEVLTSASTVPGDFRILNTPFSACWYPPDQNLTVAWTQSEGVWAYFSETILSNLRFALESENIPVEIDPLYLTGLSVSAADTTIVFPSEFGLFDRDQLDQELAIRLQRGVPENVRADIGVVAVDRNYVNWVRGGNFNPSGQVRVPSVRGDGTGFFGTTVIRGFRLVSQDLGGGSSARCRDVIP